ncbi:hypothetical protein [Aeromonas jandaei]|uniref:hypothetical protein n=1 Tax=Aeromonas jandaei TaxID=650 RepID=UPI001ADD7215|nr:hypothetical protein [Aeromonas jandaei]QTL93358.1 hypothetical protein AjGTCBM29_01203 [Aeromonas jandaei]
MQSNSKAMKAHFKNFTLFVNAKHVVGEVSGKKLHTYSINSVSVKNNVDGVISNLKTKLTEKQIGKLLTAAGYPIRQNGVVNSFGKAMRQSIKSVFDMNTTRDAYSQNGTELKEKDSAYAFIDTTGGIVKIWIIDVDYSNQYAKCFVDRILGTITCIVCKEQQDARSTCDIYQELICDNNGREGRANPFAKGNNMTHHIEHMNKVETRGRKARKVEAVITKTSTLEENNVATAELKEKYNEAAEIINEQQAEFAEMKAKMAEFEKMKAELEQLKSIMYPQRKSIFSSGDQARIDIDAPFNFEEIERI